MAASCASWESGQYSPKGDEGYLTRIGIPPVGAQSLLTTDFLGLPPGFGLLHTRCGEGVGVSSGGRGVPRPTRNFESPASSQRAEGLPTPAPTCRTLFVLFAACAGAWVRSRADLGGTDAGRAWRVQQQRSFSRWTLSAGFLSLRRGCGGVRASGSLAPKALVD
jgi:hypothetical protein